MRPSENQESFSTPKAFLKGMSIIYFVMLSGMVVFTAVVLMISSTWHFSLIDSNDPFIFVVPILATIVFFMSGFMFKKLLENTVNKSSLKEKLLGYQSALIIKIALIEGATLFAIIAAFLSSNLFYISIVAFLVLYYLMQKPSKQKIEEDLKLTGDLKDQFNRIDG